MELRKGIVLLIAAAAIVVAAGSLSYQYATWFEVGYWPDLSVRLAAPDLASGWYSQGVLSSLWANFLGWQIWQAFSAVGLLALYSATYM